MNTSTELANSPGKKSKRVKRGGFRKHLALRSWSVFSGHLTAGSSWWQWLPGKNILEEPSVTSLDSHRAKAGGEVGDEVVSKVVGCQQGLLDLVVEAQLPDGHQDGPA